MAWEPIHRKQEDTVWKTLASRGAAVVLGGALLFGSYKLASAASSISQDMRDRGMADGYRGRRRQSSGTGIFWIGAAVTGVAGAGILGIGLLPMSVMEKFVGEV